MKSQASPNTWDQSILSVKYSAAALASTFCVQILHPFDLIKTRFQSHDGMAGSQSKNLVPQYRSISDAFRTIIQQEGYQGLYKGFGWALFASAVSRTFFFTLYEKSRDFYSNSEFNKDTQVFLASTQSGIIATSITTPMWILKTRMMLDTSSNISGISNLKQAVISIHRQHGILGFWRGLSVSLPLCFHGTIQMSVFEKIQDSTKGLEVYDQYKIRPAVAGLLSKLAAILVTYPLQTIRTRIQQSQYSEIVIDKANPKYKNVSDIIRKLYQNEGLLCLYKGVKPSLIMNLPSASIYFYCYEFFKRQLGVSRETKSH